MSNLKLIKISSRQNNKLRQLLQNRKSYFFFEGEKLVQDILQQKKADILIGLEESSSKLFAFQQSTEQLWLVSSTVMSKISTLQTPPSMIAVFRHFSSTIDFSGRQIIAAFLEVQDPGNLGTIFRSAAAFGLKNIALVGNCVHLNNPKFLRAAQNALFVINWQGFRSLDQLLKKAQKNGYRIFLTDSHRGTEQAALKDVRSPALILFGSEGQGLPAELFLNYPVIRLKQTEQIESLNVGISAALIFYLLQLEGKIEAIAST